MLIVRDDMHIEISDTRKILDYIRVSERMLTIKVERKRKKAS